MIDEMDLLRDLRDAEPVRPRAYEEARGALRSAMAAEGTASPRRARWSMRRTVGFSAAALVAASAATALVVTSAGTPGEPPAEPATGTGTGNPILTQLVAEISPVQAKAPGDATLVVRNKLPTSDKVTDYGADLFTDSGIYYWGVDKNELKKAVADKDGGDDVYKRPIAAALYAVKGDIDTARARMMAANLPAGEKLDFDVTHDKTLISKLKAKAKAEHKQYVPPKPLTEAQKKGIIDNRLWMNSTDAMITAPTNPQVRAGALRVLATMPHVKVAKTTTDGKPTLTLSNRWTFTSIDRSKSKGVDKLVINASTGQPIAMSTKGSDMTDVTIYYHTARVEIADIRAGKF
ncbi:hypothetical protein [Actinomadura sp. BRA 177]|uniref:hypothetical protein n=1 Tax=Actinomadura sp. BRA 177 TaxID=2745202 RepID=UPI001595786E|nr:hypothetical protein [Actinomadura sp. BRA 177]NVI90829.1 hypothetical protein [Actinomadura sp. BRA 177]